MEKVDGMGASALKGLLRDERMPLSSKDVTDLSFFVAAQMRRVLAVRNDMGVAF